jgi:hypothetical protein
VNKENPMKEARKRALGYPEAEEGIACAGTSLEKRTIKVRSKAFLFLGPKDLMLKLGESLAEARIMASREPDRYHAGASGWVKVDLEKHGPPPIEVLARWIDESYRLLAPRTLVAALPPPGGPAGAPGGKAGKRKAARKARGR